MSAVLHEQQSLVWH